MPSRPNTIVFDSWGIIAFYEDEPAGKQVANIIADANEHGTPLWMSIVNVAEVWYIIARRASEADADEAISELQVLGIQFDNAEWKVARQAGLFKSKFTMSLADAFAAALAVQKNAHLATGDGEFKQIEGRVKILWLSP